MARLCPYFIQLLQSTDAKDSSLLPKTLPSLSAVTLLPAFPSSRATASLMDAYLAASLWAWSLALISSHFSLLSLSDFICSHIQVRPIFLSPDPASPWTSDSAFWCYWSLLHCHPPNIFKVDVFKIHHPIRLLPKKIHLYSGTVQSVLSCLVQVPPKWPSVSSIVSLKSRLQHALSMIFLKHTHTHP